MTIVIGLTGSFGSGCSCIIKEFIASQGYEKISLSTILKKTYKKEKGKEPPSKRNTLQTYGNELREKGGNEYLAKKAEEIIEAETADKWVIDSLKNPHEIEYLKNKYPEFYLFSIFADYDTRWARVKKIYNSVEDDFKEDDKRDQNEDINHGQRVTDCCDMADIIISNNENIHKGGEDYNKLQTRIKYYLSLVEKKIKFEPKNCETLMAMAYANSLRSKCLKRKVGAIIIDIDGNVFSSGLNNTPVSVKPCIAEYGECIRDRMREDYKSSINECVQDQQCREQILERFKGFKILDYCRALHAEESAILNSAKTGSTSALKGATLYTTTYPCNLCANKIVKVGITDIVYAEPYPMLEAKKILKKEKVNQYPFEGVSFNGYFRVGRRD